MNVKEKLLRKLKRAHFLLQHSLQLGDQKTLFSEMPPRFLRLHQKTGFISWNKTWTSLPRIYRSWWREKGCRQREILFRPRHRHLIFSSMEYLTWGIKRNRGRKTGLQLFQQRPHIEPPRTSLIARIWEIRRNRSHKKGQKAASSASFLSHVPAVYSACYCGLGG